MIQSARIVDFQSNSLMSSAKQVISNAFESSASDRLAGFIAQQGFTAKEVIPLTPDASTRKYYRIGWKKRTAVAAVYPELAANLRGAAALSALAHLEELKARGAVTVKTGPGEALYSPI